ncbi:hypothetical protein SUDANB121_00169 [Nocardiopsis dassonvillei]|uniref:erythromycin esterase family protein n=1 Tax=Nocardiopsis dassonvillei TaxID=2014 RepID=UPI003F556342
MSLDITDLATPACELLALGEPVSGEPAFPLVRNELFARLAGHGFRSIALETDRDAARTLDGFVRGTVPAALDAVMREGFPRGPGEPGADRQLVVWMREYNRGRPPGERLALHGFGTAGPVGDGRRSGAGSDAATVRHLLDIREAERRRGPTLVYAHNRRLRKNPGRRDPEGAGPARSGTGAVLSELTGGRYSFVAGSLGRSDALRLGHPEPGTHEAFLDGRVGAWGLVDAVTDASARVRADRVPARDHLPLDGATLAGADAILHVADGAAAAASF